MALILRELRVQYGSHVAVDDLSLTIGRGEIVALLGPNGSGKSTTLAVAAGLLDPLLGTVSIDGIARAVEPDAFAARVGFVPQETSLYDELTAEQNLAFFGRLYGLHGCDLDARIARGLTRARLLDRAGERVGRYSGGLKQRLSIACAMLHDPAVLLLDEPTASLDPASREALFADLHRLKEDGHAVLLTTHHLDEAEHGCDRVAVLERGKLVACGSPRDLLRGGPTGRAILYGHLRDELPRFLSRSLKARLKSAGVEMEVTGRRVRLAAETSASLGRGLALLLAEGATLETFRTPPGRMTATYRLAEHHAAT